MKLQPVVHEMIIELPIPEVCDATTAVTDGPPEDLNGVPIPAELSDPHLSAKYILRLEKLREAA